MKVLILCLALLLPSIAQAEELWKITAYCSCKICCGKSDGITASGKQARQGYVACNWLPFGTKLNIEGLGDFVVMDRGAKSLFGSKANKVKHLDIWCHSHMKAKLFGVKYRRVIIYAK